MWAPFPTPRQRSVVSTRAASWRGSPFASSAGVHAFAGTLAGVAQTSSSCARVGGEALVDSSPGVDFIEVDAPEMWIKQALARPVAVGR